MIIGKKVGKILKIPSIKLKVDKENCISCKLCSVNCSKSIKVHELENDEYINDDECILCGQCADSCPKKLIKFTIKSKYKVQE